MVSHRRLVKDRLPNAMRHQWTKASADAAASGPPLYGVVKRAKMPLNDDTKAGYEKAANMSAVRFPAC
jgi:hypothetical protein